MRFLLLFLLSSNAFAIAENTGLKLGAAADVVGFFGKDQSTYPRRLDIREVEFNFYGPIDHGFDGLLSFATHNEDGTYHLELHEAYLASSKLLPNLRLKAGKFFLGIGRLNQVHRHDWPFLSTPKMQSLYLNEEAAVDTGVQANYVLPFLPFFTELSLGLTNGWTFGHSHNQGTRPKQPTHYVRFSNFLPLGENGGLQLGTNYLGRNSREDGRLQLFGFDIVAKWKESAITNWLLQAELFGRNLRPINARLERSFAGYLYTQKHLSGNFYGGLRFDAYSLDTSAEKNIDYSIIPTLSYKHSEFSLFRAAYQWDFEKRSHRDSLMNRVAQIQFVYFLGDHPSHDF
jgi:hypothetical protein